MTISEDRLLAYVDGLLSEEEVREIEQELARDADARTVVEALRASALPYREAVTELIDVPDLSKIETDIRRSHTRPAARIYRFASIAAALLLFFGAGLLAGHYVLPPQQEEKTQWARWVDDIAAYQALYTRATLSMPTPPPERRDVQLARISDALGQKIELPDLSGQKADFKYARMYAIDGEPLAQIAYLPAEGEPFSLCMMKTKVGDHAPRYSTARGLQLATWRSHGVAYVLIGAMDKPKLDRYVEAFRKNRGA